MSKTLSQRLELVENTLAELFDSVETLQQDYDKNQGFVKRKLDELKGDYRRVNVAINSHEANAHRRNFKDAT